MISIAVIIVAAGFHRFIQEQGVETVRGETVNGTCVNTEEVIREAVIKETFIREVVTQKPYAKRF